MENLKKFKDLRISDKPNILYIHGLDGELNKNYPKIIEDLGCNYIGISFDYRSITNIITIIENIKIDGIIGHSLGGYVAYYISNIQKIPSLLLMPSFDPEDVKYVKIPSRILRYPIFKKKDVLIGEKDDAVDSEIQMSALKGFDIFKEKIGHDLTDKIFKKYSKIFIDKYFN